MLMEKLRTSVAGWISVADTEVADEYRRRNEKVKLDLVPVTADGFRSQVTVTDAELAAHFDKNKETYRIGEKRKIRYALVEVDKVRERRHRARRRHPVVLRAEHGPVHDEGAGARQPHPAQDRGQGRERGAGPGRRGAEAGRGGADFAALAKQTPRTSSARTTAAT